MSLCSMAFLLGTPRIFAEGTSIRLCEEAGEGKDCLGNLKKPATPSSNPAPWPESVGRKTCPADWLQSRKGGCLTQVTTVDGQRGSAYVHPGGWLVDARCFSDKRFKASELLAALELVQRKISPTAGLDKGGCLSKFNPEWGAELVNASWEKGIYVDCPPLDPSDSEPSCAAHVTQGIRASIGSRGYRRETELSLLSLENVAGCMGSGTTGLAGVLFHEFLHAAGADNYPTEKHNTAWRLQDYVFVSDRVYGTEALCFFGVDDARKDLVNVLQCRQAASYRAIAPRFDLCRGFSTSFTDMPAKFIKH